MSKEIAISVQNVSKSFRLPHERFTGLKQTLIKFRFGKKYEEQKVLKELNFDIEKGEFFGIVGRNGSGKSTLLKVMAQIYTPERGGVKINGTLTPFIELGVGFNPELTGRENVFLNGALLGFDRKQTAAMYDAIVDFAELHEFMDQKLKNYSSGMQVRLAFSVAIRAKSDILLIDEVLAVGDAAFQSKCFDYFEELKKEHRTIILVSHDMASIRRFCTTGILIEKGRIVESGDVNEVASAYALLNKPKAESVGNNQSKSKIGNVDVSINKTDLDINVEYKLGGKDHTSPPIIGVAITNQQGVYIVGFNNLKENRSRASSEGTHNVRLKAQIGQLLPNDYLVNVSLYTDSFQLLDHINYAASFSTGAKNDKSKDGAYDMPVTWGSIK